MKTDAFLVIRALLSASGPLGISEFLPPPDRKLPASNSLANYVPTTAPPHLPLGSDYRDIDFSLDSVMGPWLAEVSIRRGLGAAVSVREWTMMVIQRYRYVVGEWASSTRNVGLLIENRCRRALNKVHVDNIRQSSA